MPHDPFKPPSSDVSVPDIRRGSAVKAVVLGAVTDIVGSMIASFVFFVAYGAYLAMTGNSPDQIGARTGDVGFDSPVGILVNIVGCLFSVLGGFVCARVAKHSEYKLGGILSAVSVALGVLVSGGAEPMIALYSLLTIASVMIGIHIGARRNRSALREAARAGALP